MSIEQSKILMLGGAGFVGESILRHLVVKTPGRNILVVDRDVNRSNQMSERFGIETLIGNLEDFQTWRQIVLQGPFSKVFHLAANSDIRLGSLNPILDFRDTLLTSLLLAEFLKEIKPEMVLFASSSAIFGAKESSISSQDELMPKIPISSYGWSKLASESALTQACQEVASAILIVRFPNVVGGSVTHGILYDFKMKLRKNPHKLQVLGNGSQTKPYIHVDDLVEVIMNLFEENTTRKLVVNIGPKDTLMVREIVDIVREITGLNFDTQYQLSESGWEGDVVKYSYASSESYSYGNIRSSSQAVYDAFYEWWNK